MISKLLTEIKLKDASYLLQRYITSLSCVKVLRRLRDKDLSKPFSISLNELQGSAFPNYTHTTYNKTHSQRDKSFLYTLLDLTTRTHIPNLRKQAQAALQGEPFELYTEQTRGELHNLLCELLEKYESSLEILAVYHN